MRGVKTVHVLLAALAVGGVIWVRRRQSAQAVARVRAPVVDPLIKFLTVSSLNPYSGNYRTP